MTTTEAETDNAMTISVAKEANAFSAGDNKACSDRGNRENKYSNGMTAAENWVGTM